MKQNMVETLLGAFVLIVAVIFFIYGTGKAGAGSSTGYNITAQFTDIGGLGQGDDVKISGVPVGSIAGIGLDDNHFALVTMKIDNDVKLPYDTSARISSEGLLGGTYMALDVGYEENYIEPNGTIEITQSAQNLEQLLGQFIFSLQDTEDDSE